MSRRADSTSSTRRIGTSAASVSDIPRTPGYLVKAQRGTVEPTPPVGLLLRGGGVVLLLACELLMLTIRFDTQAVPELGGAPTILRAALAFAAVFLLVVSPRLTVIVGALAVAEAGRRWLAWLGMEHWGNAVF